MCSVVGASVKRGLTVVVVIIMALLLSPPSPPLIK